MSDVNGGALSLSSGPSFSGSDQGSSQGTLKVSETATYMAMYIVQQSAIDAGGVSNQAVASASTPQSVTVTDTSDDPTTGAANDPTVTTITGSPSIEVTKTATVNDINGDGKIGATDYIYYTIKIENKGNVTLSGLTISDTLTDGNGGSLTLNNGPSYDSTTLGSSPGTLKVGEIQT